MFEFDQNKRLERAQVKPWTPGSPGRPLRPIASVERVGNPIELFERAQLRRTGIFGGRALRPIPYAIPVKEEIVEEQSGEDQGEPVEWNQVSSWAKKPNDGPARAISKLEEEFDDEEVKGRQNFEIPVGINGERISMGLFHPEAPRYPFLFNSRSGLVPRWKKNGAGKELVGVPYTPEQLEKVPGGSYVWLGVSPTKLTNFRVPIPVYVRAHSTVKPLGDSKYVTIRVKLLFAKNIRIRLKRNFAIRSGGTITLPWDFFSGSDVPAFLDKKKATQFAYFKKILKNFGVNEIEKSRKKGGKDEIVKKKRNVLKMYKKYHREFLDAYRTGVLSSFQEAGNHWTKHLLKNEVRIRFHFVDGGFLDEKVPKLTVAGSESVKRKYPGISKYDRTLVITPDIEWAKQAGIKLPVAAGVVDMGKPWSGLYDYRFISLFSGKNKENYDNNRIWMIHEVGHMLGIPDHSGMVMSYGGKSQGRPNNKMVTEKHAGYAAKRFPESIR